MRLPTRLAAAAALVCSPLVASAVPFAGEDFDMGATNGGLTALTEVFTPNNSVNGAAGPDDPGDDGGFPSSGFDLFGETSRDSTGFVPFDIVDDSAGSFPPDLIGILESTKTDRVVAVADTVNGSNPGGTVSAVWTFDISGRSNIQMSVDLAIAGDFDADDDFAFTYSIDGGAQQTAFDIQIDEDVDPMFGLTDSGIFYGSSMESGTFTDRYESPFFEQTELDALLAFGPGSTGLPPGTSVDFHPDDNGMDGDVTAMDGMIPIEFLGGVDTAISGYQVTNGFGTFDQAEFEPYKDPLFVNPTVAPDASGNNFDSGTQLSDEFQTVTADIQGTGTTLTLTFTGLANGSLEYLLFDNISFEEGASSVPGDTDGDGDVDLVDLDNLGNNFGLMMGATVAQGDFDGDGDVDLVDLDTLGGNFGFGTATAVPEPSTMLLGALALAGLAARRR